MACPHTPNLLGADKAAVLKHLEVLNHRRKSDPKRPCKLAGRRRPSAKLLDEPPPRRIPEGMEDLVNSCLVKHTL
jgi:hypothetical protein